ncbi:mitofusin-2-like [Sycon ciliatum]|uniref:mitofusin-2-like n=1 Tax=Sycon ciliatum TaxID=27933 RepID=UPI0031F7154D
MSASIVGTPQRPATTMPRSGSFSVAAGQTDPVRRDTARRRGFERSSSFIDEKCSSVDQTSNGKSSIPLVGLQSVSPLQRFGIAKERITNLFENVRGMLDESVNRLLTHADDDVLRTHSELNKLMEEAKRVIDADQERMANISEKVRTNSMKVAFFGRTSNGKSSVINAMLRDRILPSGIGHTTSCFLCVQGTPEASAFLVTPGSTERKSIKTVQQLAHSLHDDKLESKAQVQMFWPREKCSLLKNDVVLLDSPGIDINPDLDSWINAHCTDADVFVLVANAESTLMLTEKKFFHKVAQMSSKPNIFILNNRWDASASEPEFMDEVRSQHLSRNLDFLADELNVVSREEGMDRVFFVSAKEALYLRMKERNPNTGVVALADGYRARLQEFEAFERVFEETISSHAIKTKFGAPANTGLQVTKRLHQTLESLRTQIEDVRRQCQQQLVECQLGIATLQRETSVCSAEWGKQVDDMKVRALQQVSSAISQEIVHLCNTVQEYHTVAVFNEEDLDAYRQELCEHITRSMGEHMMKNSTQLLSDECSTVQQSMLERFQQAVPPSVTTSTANLFIRPAFHVSHEVDIGEICTNFRPDLKFRFGRQWCALLNWIRGGAIARLSTSSDSRNTSPSSTIESRARDSAVPSARRSSSSSVMSVLSSSSPTAAAAATAASLEMCGLPAGVNVQRLVEVATIVSSQAPWLMVGAGVLLYRLVGWQVLAAGTVVGGGLYGYERLCWTTRAKERAFKEQMVDFATGKLKDIVAVISANSGSQVQQQLSNCKDQLCAELSVVEDNLRQRKGLVEKQIHQLQRVESDARSLVNTAQFAESGFRQFLTELELTVVSPTSPLEDSVSISELVNGH